MSNKAELVIAERSRYCDDLLTERDKVKSLKTSLNMAKARIAQLEKERDETAEKAKNAERELGRMQRGKKRNMKEVDENQAGYDRAAPARSMVNDEIKKRIPIMY